MKKVLIPLDDSQFSRKILPHVRDIFDPGRFEIILFRAAQAPEVTIPQGYWLGSQRLPNVAGSEFAAPTYGPARPVYAQQEWEDFEETLKRELEADMDSLRKAGYGVTVAVHFGDDPAQEIVSFAGREGVDVVAMASHGRTGLGRLLRGSVAEKVFHQLSIPVLLLHAVEEAADERGRAQGAPREWEQIEANWQHHKASAKATWSKLSEAELDMIAGKRERLISKLEECYGMSRDDAEREVHNWQLSLREH
jgi:nucleotide-binding universal stress UspA family protein/uncharacterized protein YjbJ (UPF0337 family)